MNAIGNTPLLKLEAMSESVWAAIQRARELGHRKKIVTINYDSGLKYLNGGLYK